MTITGSLATDKAIVVTTRRMSALMLKLKTCVVTSSPTKSTVSFVGGEILATVTVMDTVAFPGTVALLVALRGAAGK